MKLSQLDKVGPHVAAYRNKAGLTQQQLATETGLSPQFIGFIENGNRNISLQTLIKITNVFGVDVITFLSPFEQQDENLGQLIQKIEHSSKKDSYIQMFNNILDTATDE